MSYKTIKAFLRVFLILFPLLSATAIHSASALESGEKIFTSGKCSRCHTLGRGRFVGPDLLGVGEKYSEDDLVKWAKNPELIYSESERKPVNEGYPPMPPANLSEEDARLVVDYILNYSPPAGLSKSGTVKGSVKNLTSADTEAGIDVILTSYLGDIGKNRRFAKTDSLGRFSFSGLEWDRSHELTLFYQEVRYVSRKLVFSPEKDEITVDLPVYEASGLDENISVDELNVIVYPNDESTSVSVTFLYSFQNSGNTVFTGKSVDSDIVTLAFPVPKTARDVSFSENIPPDSVVRKNKRIYSQLPVLPGTKRVALSYSIPISRFGGSFPLSFDYEAENLSVFVRETALGLKISKFGAIEEKVTIHGEEFSKYERSNVKPASFNVFIPIGSLIKRGFGKYSYVLLFFGFVFSAALYFFFSKKFSLPRAGKN